MPTERDAALADARQIVAVQRTLVASNALARSGVDMRVLREVHEAIIRAGTPEPAGERRAAQVAAMAMERMLEAREVMASRPPVGTTPGMSRDLRTLERDLQREYRVSESKVLRELASGALFSGSMADPNLASLLSDHRERVEDLRRLRRFPQWIAAIQRLHPPAAKDFDVYMRRRAMDLLAATRRTEARQSLDRFERELAMFASLPVEPMLRRPQASLVHITGGLHVQLADRISELRRAWVDDWSRAQQTSEPARDMLMILRLMQTMRDCMAITDVSPNVLNRWPMWQMHEDVVIAGQREMTTRLRLATAAAVQGQHAVLTEHLDRLDRDAPVARLAGRLMSLLGSQLRECDGSAVGVLRQLSMRPTDQAALLVHREDFARLCRYVAEAVHAREHRSAEVARDCDDYAAALAMKIMRALDG
jgi:hypothetical protein